MSVYELIVLITYVSRDIWFPTMRHFHKCDSDEPVRHPFKLRNSKLYAVSSTIVKDYSSDKQRLWSDCAYDRLVWAFAGRTYHIVGNLMSRLMYKLGLDARKPAFGVYDQARIKTVCPSTTTSKKIENFAWSKLRYYTFPRANNILREKSLAIYFEDSQFRRNRTFNFILSKIYVDKRSQVRCH